ncbi:P-loop NTPase fold protein [Pseudolysinimonas sp.]
MTIAEHDFNLNRERLVESFATQLDESATRSTSRVFAITGRWGAGKSWLLERIAARLAQTGTDGGQTTLVTHFNPWLFPDEQSLQTGFATLLLGKKLLRKRGRLFASGLLSLVGGAANVAPIQGVAGVSGTVDRTTAAIAKRLSPVGSPRALRMAIENAMGLRGRRLFVIMDDLDRLSPAELLTVFRLVRLVGDVPNLHYVLAYDQDSVLALLGQSDVARSPGRAEQYLEKIIDRRLTVPPLTGAQLDALTVSPVIAWARTVDPDLTDTDEATLRFRLTPLAFRNIATPRAAERYLGALAVLRPDMAREVNLEDWVRVAILRTFFPRVWELVLSDRDVLTGVVRDITPNRDAISRRRAQQLQTQVQHALQDSPQSEEIQELLTSLFPAFSKLLEGRSVGEVDSNRHARERRIAHPEFFDRYLWLDVPPGFISEALVAHHVRRLPHPEAIAALRELFAEASQATLDAIVRHAQNADQPAIVTLLEELPSSSDQLSAPRVVVEVLANQAIALLAAMGSWELTRVWDGDRRLYTSPVIRSVLTNVDAFSHPRDDQSARWVRRARSALRAELLDAMLTAPSPAYDELSSREDFLDLLRLDQETARHVAVRKVEEHEWMAEDIASIYLVSFAGDPPIIRNLDWAQLERDIGVDVVTVLVENAAAATDPDIIARESPPGSYGIAATPHNVREVTRHELANYLRRRGWEEKPLE